jgi:hypothetical protein
MRIEKQEERFRKKLIWAGLATAAICVAAVFVAKKLAE